MLKNNAPRRYFIITSLAVIIVLVFAMMFGGMFNYITADTENYLISDDASYVICGGKKYIAVDDSFNPDSDFTNGKSEIIKDFVKRENDSIIDSIFTYGYVIYAVDGYSDGEVIYVHTAESGDSAAGYYVIESDADIILGEDTSE